MKDNNRLTIEDIKPLEESASKNYKIMVANGITYLICLAGILTPPIMDDINSELFIKGLFCIGGIGSAIGTFNYNSKYKKDMNKTEIFRKELYMKR